MWGTPPRGKPPTKRPRFIPTRVGNTRVSAPAQILPAVHPHACGEHWTTSVTPSMRSGSSPRVWGTLGLGHKAQARARFIPTRVGNTTLPAGRYYVRAVHPHACGEHCMRVFINFCIGGSSPRVWGTPWLACKSASNKRFIPTRVGNTFYTSYKGGGLAVHPHACGEHAMREARRGNLCGSSPRVWGTLKRSDTFQYRGRFIPTRVGNTPDCRFSAFLAPVHPHACGEHPVDRGRGRGNGGSSPRVWGTRAKWIASEWQRRFIPTRVGNTLR